MRFSRNALLAAASTAIALAHTPGPPASAPREVPLDDPLAERERRRQRRLAQQAEAWKVTEFGKAARAAAEEKRARKAAKRLASRSPTDAAGT